MKSRVNLGKAGPQRKTRKKRAVKMQLGGMAPTINPNIPNAPPGRPGPMPMQPPIMGNVPMPMQPPIMGNVPMPPGGKKGGSVAKKKAGGAVKKKTGGGVKKMQAGGTAQQREAAKAKARAEEDAARARAAYEKEQTRRNTPVGESTAFMTGFHPDGTPTGRRSRATAFNARRQLKKQQAAGGPGRRATRGIGPGGKKGGAVKRKKGGSVKK
mgnify:CR=1 FL=1